MEKTWAIREAELREEIAQKFIAIAYNADWERDEINNALSIKLAVDMARGSI